MPLFTSDPTKPSSDNDSKETSETGAVRSKLYRQGRRFPIRLDLMARNTAGMERLAEAYAEGYAKYGLDNWKKGFKESVLINHAADHINLYLAGDTSEDHVGHAIWNLMTLCWVQENKPELLDLTRKTISYATGDRMVSNPSGQPLGYVVSRLEPGDVVQIGSTGKIEKLSEPSIGVTKLFTSDQLAAYRQLEAAYESQRLQSMRLREELNTAQRAADSFQQTGEARLKALDSAHEEVARLSSLLRKQPSDYSAIKQQLCEQILTELSGAGVTTPEETYGTHIHWAVNDFCRAYRQSRERVSSLKAANIEAQEQINSLARTLKAAQDCYTALKQGVLSLLR